MINGRKVLAVIPARGGSKGIKNKNIIDLGGGKPLIAYTIEAARNTSYVDNVVVSTDSEQIAQVAREYGASVPFLRPAELAKDTSKTIDAVMHVIEEMKKRGQKYDILLLLQCTSPLRTADDIKGALEKFERNHEISLVAVSKVTDHPILIRKIIDDVSMERLLPINSTVRRQDMPEYYRVNGSIYINRVDELTLDTSLADNLQPYVIAENHAVDIDSFPDLELVKYYLKQQK
jgi:CMP-N-acetylneuraminic acid synthetase